MHRASSMAILSNLRRTNRPKTTDQATPSRSPFCLVSGGPEPQKHLPISATSICWIGADRVRPEHVRWQVYGGIQRGRIQAKSGEHIINRSTKNHFKERAVF